MAIQTKMAKRKLNKKYSSRGGTSLKVLGLVVLLVIVLNGIVLARKWKVNRSVTRNAENSSQNQNQGAPNANQGTRPAMLPATLQVELPQNKKTAKVERNSLNQQEIIFYSSASADDIIAFYKKWAPAHNFVFLPEEQSLAQSERIAFSLVPSLGANGLYTHYFILEPKKNEVRVIFAYSDAAPPQKRDNSENAPSGATLPKDFKIKL